MQSVFNSNEDVKSDNFDLFVIYLQKRCLKTLQRNNSVQLVTSHRERQTGRQLLALVGDHQAQEPVLGEGRGHGSQII